jgi:hypothetical protein
MRWMGHAACMEEFIKVYGLSLESLKEETYVGGLM